MNRHTAIAAFTTLTMFGVSVPQVGFCLPGNTDAVLAPQGSGRALGLTDLAKAKPYQNPLPSPDTSNVRAFEGEDPSISDLVPGVAGQSDAIGARAFGTFGIPYTSSRVYAQAASAIPWNSGYYLSTTFPYRAVGRLTFGGGGYCSASLIRRSVIVTAAHCIQNFGSGSTIFGGYTYTPAYYNTGTTPFAPYGNWGWAALARPGTWMYGSDPGVGAARMNDLAVIILNKNAGGQFVGDITGRLTYGWNNYSFVSSPKTGNLPVAAVSSLGYPGLLDGGRLMQRTDGPSYLTSLGSALQIYQGSDFTGGSSGGPWVVNLGFNPGRTGGAVAGSAAVRNVVVGVTSWGASDPNAPKDNWSSRFSQNPQYPLGAYGTYGAGNIGSLLNSVCKLKPSGSASTFEQLGYCNP